MQILISVIDDQTSSASAAEMAAIDAFNAHLRARRPLGGGLRHQCAG